jgi:hypothetical protein
MTIGNMERAASEHIAATAANVAHESGRYGWDGREERRNTLAKIAKAAKKNQRFRFGDL